MKTKKMLAIGTMTLAMAFSTATFAGAQMQLDSVNIKTHVEADKVTGTDGGKVLLSSVDIFGDSKINGGSLEVDSKTEAGTVKAEGEGALVSLASLLIHDGSEIGNIDGLLKMDAQVGDVNAREGVISVGSVLLNNSKINGSLKVTGDGIKATTGDLTVQEGAELGVASIMMGGSEAEEIKIDRMEAHLQNVTVEDGGRAYFSTLKMNNTKAGKINFSGYSDVGSDVTVPEGALLNVASAVIENAEIGDATFDLYADVDSIEMSGDSVVMIGGANIQ